MTSSSSSSSSFPSKYLIYLREIFCRNCGSKTTERTVMGVYPAKNGSVARPVVTLQYNTLIAISHLNQSSIPVCEQCYQTISLSHLPSSEEIDRWEERVHAQIQLQQQKQQEEKQKQKPFDPDDVIF